MAAPCWGIWAPGHQDRAARGRQPAQLSVHARRGEPRVPRRQSQQARHRPRPQASRRPGRLAADGRGGGRARSQLPALGPAAARHRLRADEGRQSAPDLLRADGLRRDRPAQGPRRVRPGAADHDRDLRRAGEAGRSGNRVRVRRRLLLGVAAGLRGLGGPVRAQSHRPRPVRGRVAAAQRARDAGHPPGLGGRRGPRRRARHALGRDHGPPSDEAAAACTSRPIRRTSGRPCAS